MILNFPQCVLFQLFPEGGEVGGEGGLVGAVGLVELVFVGDPGGEVGEVVLEDSFHFVDGLVDLRLLGFQGVHFRVEGGHFAAVGLGEGIDPGGEQVFLA